MATQVEHLAQSIADAVIRLVRAKQAQEAATEDLRRAVWGWYQRRCRRREPVGICCTIELDIDDLNGRYAVACEWNAGYNGFRRVRVSKVESYDPSEIGIGVD